MPEAPARRQNEAEGTPPWLKSALQSVGIFLLVQFGMKMFTNGLKIQTSPEASNSTTPKVDAKNLNIPSFSDRPAFNELQGEYNPSPHFISPIWPENTIMDVSLYVSPSVQVAPLKTWPKDSLIMHETDLKLGNWTDSREIHTSFSVPVEVQNNGTLWAHFFVAQSGSQLDPTATDYDMAKAFHFVRPLTQHFLKKKVAKTRNLVSGGHEEEPIVEEPTTGPVVASYYHPNFTLSIIPDSGLQSYTQMQPAMREHLELERSGARDLSGQNGWYYPILFLNTFWQLRGHMTEMNSTVTHLPLHIHLNSLSNWKFNLMAGMDYNMKQNAEKAAQGQSLTGGGDGSEMEQIKSVLLDSNIYLLGTTVVVSIFHMIFEMLAFKSDVSHFRNKKDNVGVSVRTIMANVFMQLIIFLYLLDNNENTSWMILLGQGMGILIEAWKITKTVDVRIRPTPADSTSIPWRYLPYTIVFEDKHKLSDTEKKTQEYDEIAFRYLYMVAVPLLGAYAVYSLLYDTHKSWYSFIITTLVGSVYAYGFLMMVPSLYINYRLKSVAHMPAKAMTYKFLNTFIDDLFAFTIKMPTLHRLATLRDDVIFFVYLYQSYAYKVDYTRVNEFGQGGGEEEVDAKLASKPLQAPAEGKIDGNADAVAGDGVAEAVGGDDKAVKTSGRAQGAAKKRK